MSQFRRLDCCSPYLESTKSFFGFVKTATPCGFDCASAGGRSSRSASVNGKSATRSGNCRFCREMLSLRLCCEIEDGNVHKYSAFAMVYNIDPGAQRAPWRRTLDLLQAFELVQLAGAGAYAKMKYAKSFTAYSLRLLTPRDEDSNARANIRTASLTTVTCRLIGAARPYMVERATCIDSSKGVQIIQKHYQRA